MVGIGKQFDNCNTLFSGRSTVLPEHWLFQIPLPNCILFDYSLHLITVLLTLDF